MARQALKPFGSLKGEGLLAVEATARCRGQKIDIRYEAVLDESVVVPTAGTGAPVRQDRLWETTCFEFFLAIDGEPGYLEFNLSPSANWNVYRFSSYRDGMTREEGITRIPIRATRQDDRLTLEAEADLSGVADFGPALTSDRTVLLGITAVIDQGAERKSYWALAHARGKPDFHRRETFVLSLGHETRNR